MDSVVVSFLTLIVGVAQLVLVALGLAIVYGLMKVINFAHGEFLAMGALLTVTLTRAGLDARLAMIVSPLSVGLLGILAERITIRFLYGRLIDSLLATFGVSLVMTSVMGELFGSAPAGMKTFTGSISIGRYRFDTYSILLVIVTLGLMALTWLVFSKTMYGIRARAAVLSPEHAASLGINASRVNMVTFAYGVTLAGAAGALLAPLVAVEPFMGQKLLARSFLVVLVGGAAPLTGLAAAGSILGVTQYVVAKFATVFVGHAAVLVAAIFLVKLFPAGLSEKWRSEI